MPSNIDPNFIGTGPVSKNGMKQQLTHARDEINTLETLVLARLPLAGGTLTGALTLHADPTAALHASSKQYVDAQVGTRVAKAGDTMTGSLTISNNDSRLTLNSTTSNYRQVVITTDNATRWAIGADNAAESGSNSGSNFFINRFNDAGLFVDTPLVISRSNGQISFSSSLPIVGPSATPTASNHLSTKGYVDAAISALQSGRRLTGVYVFTSTQNWTRPDGTTAMLVYAIGGGGGGGKGWDAGGGGGGGEAP